MALIQPVVDGKIPKDTSTTSKSDTSNDLGYDQFLQLLCAEMQYQDPLEPTSNTEYVAQLATFSQMEATLGMQSTIESSNANALVGKYVIIKTTSSTGETTAIIVIKISSGAKFASDSSRATKKFSTHRSRITTVTNH